MTEVSSLEETRDLRDIRVLVVFGGIPLHGQERGNIEVFRSLKQLGAQARFITHRRWGHLAVQPELDRHGIEWTTAPFGPLMGRNLFGTDFFHVIFGLLTTNWALWREVRGWRPTHIHCMNWLYVVYASPLILLLRIPLTYRLGDLPPCSTILHRWLWRLICWRAQCLVCNSNFVYTALRNSGGKPRCSRVIYNLPPQRESQISTVELSTPAGAVRLIFIGQITREKGVPLLIEAARRCISSGRNIVLRLVGNYAWRNPMAQALIADLERDGLQNRIQFLGYREDVTALLRSSDMHICPSIWGEPLANVVMEAKVQSIPSVVFPDGGLPELIEHGRDGFICTGKTVEALVEGITWFLDRPERLKSAGEAARRGLEEKFGEERFQRQWAEVFQTRGLNAQ